MQYMKGAEPFSVNNDSDIGILVIHGFTGTTATVLPLATAYAQRGYNVECPSLPGHGTRWQDLNKVHYTDWIREVENAYGRLQERAKNVFVVGFSMGGALALYLAQNHRDISGLVLINHLCFLKNPRLIFLPLLQLFKQSTREVASDIKDPTVNEIAYHRNPLKGVTQLLKMIKTARKDLAKVMQPTLIFKSKEDHIVPLDNAPYTLKRISSSKKELLWLENSYHVAPCDYDKDIIIEKSLFFFESIIEDSTASTHCSTA